MRGCDLHQGIVHPGYVDAYEVTVARFRAWVRAGMPIPRGGQDIFNGLVWDPGTKPVVPATFANSRDIVPGHTTSSSMCTYTEEPGPNDDLPVNCVSANTALLFCWWDGKHLATEVAWEYLARNRGTTATPFGDLPSDAEACRYGDVGAFNGLCPPERLPQRVDAFPLGATRDPAGIYGLYGGVMEFVIGGSRRPYGDRTEMCRSLTSAPITDGLDLGTLVHGTAWYQSLIDHQRYRHAATRGSPPVQDSALDPMLTPARSPRVGFRCMRWTPEPRDP